MNEVIESKRCGPADSVIVVWSAVDKSSYIVHNNRGLSVSLLVILIYVLTMQFYVFKFFLLHFVDNIK